jgi:ParB-like chromosome segregation protein Spo0J
MRVPDRLDTLRESQAERATKKSKGRARVKGVESQPISGVRWVDRNELTANDYNPNFVAPPELDLLKTSILEDGWTQPIVVNDENEVVDGFHRWLISGDPDVAAMTGGLVPVVNLVVHDRDHQMMATVRHNRARGTHAVLRMADMVTTLIDEHHMTAPQVEKLLGMDPEEVDRLYDHGVMTKRGSADEFSKGWVPE